MFEMKEEFKIGVKEIDEQHKRLFELTDEVYNLLMDKFKLDKYDQIVQLIQQLKEYTIFHFSSEEQYMESINYKKMFTQKIEHEAFIKKLDEINLNAIDHDQDKYILDLLNFLNEWLVHHIVEKDKLITEVK